MGVVGQPHAPAASTPGKDLVPIVQEAGLAPGPVWTGGKSRPHRDSIPDRPASSQSLHRMSYPDHGCWKSRGSNEGVSGDGMPAVSQIPSFAVTCCLHLQCILNWAAAGSCDSLVSSYKPTRRHITEGSYLRKCYRYTVSPSQCTDSSRWFTCPCSICGVYTSLLQT